MRPEEQRSQSETTPEILGVQPGQIATSPLERAQALVTQWEAQVARREPRYGDPLGLIPHLDFTNDVRDRMSADIARLLEQTISMEHTAP